MGFVGHAHSALTQLADDPAAGVVAEVAYDAGCYLWPNGWNRGEVVLRGLHHCVHRLKSACQEVCHLPADVVDPQRDQQPCQAAIPAAADGCQQVGRALLRHPVHRKHLFLLQEVEVGDILDQSAFDEGHTQLSSHALDVHGPLADKVLQQPDQLRWTGRVDTVGHRLALRSNHLVPAAGTARRHLEGHLVARTPPCDYAHDLRDDLARALHDHPVAFHQPLRADVVFVVQRSLLHGRAGYVHRLQDRIGVHSSGPADVYSDVQEPGHRLGRGELVCDGPSRLPADDTEVVLEVEAVDLDHDPVAAVV